MAVELLTNAAQSNLDGAITATATTLIVTASGSFPGSGNFRIIIDSELMIVTAVSGNTFTVVRAVEGTTGATHADGSAVTGVLTKGSIDQYLLDRDAVGVAASRPTAGVTTRLYWPNDGHKISRDNGASWENWGPLYYFNAPNASDFATWINQGSTGATSSGGTVDEPLYIFCPGSSTLNDFRLLLKALPSSTPFSLTYGFKVLTTPGSGDPRAGPVLYDNVSGKFVCMSYSLAGLSGAGVCNLYISKFTSYSSFSAHYLSGQIWPNEVTWGRIRDDGTNRYYDMSVDGSNWINIHSVGRTDFCTPTHCGIHLNAAGASTAAAMLWHHYKEG